MLLPDDIAPEMITSIPSTRAHAHQLAIGIEWAIRAGLMCSDQARRATLCLTHRGQAHLDALARQASIGIGDSATDVPEFVSAAKLHWLLASIHEDSAKEGIAAWRRRRQVTA